MKKKLLFVLLGITLILVLVALPIPKGSLDDGGTREYQALTYKIVDWNRIHEGGTYQKTKVYFGKDAHKSLNALWEQEDAPKRFTAIIQERSGYWIEVEPLEGEEERSSADRIRFNARDLEELDAMEGAAVDILYSGGIMESYPAQIKAISWSRSGNLRHMNFEGEWIEKTEETKHLDNFVNDVVISEIYADCFFAAPLIPMPYQLKINGALPENWCPGDQVAVTYENSYYDAGTHRMEGDLLTIEESTFEPDPMVCYKPVIYLYPEKEQEVAVQLDLAGKLTCTYPAYQEGWQVIASPDGTLKDQKGQSYNYLYWEGEIAADYDLSEGFCVKGEETSAFLEKALQKLGLNRREANEFIIYWLPMMEQNPYNIISFQQECYTDAARLKINPAPDTLIRVFMAWKRAESKIELPPQTLSAPARKGFCAIEWGGSEIK